MLSEVSQLRQIAAYRLMQGSLRRICASGSAHLAFDELLKLTRLARRRHLEGKDEVSGLGECIGQPEAWRTFCDVAQEDNALAVCGGCNGVVDDISFVVGVKGPQLVFCLVRVDDHQIVVSDGGVIVRGGIFGVVFADEGFALQVGLEGTGASSSLPGFRSAFAGPVADQKLQRAPIQIRGRGWLGCRDERLGKKKNADRKGNS